MNAKLSQSQRVAKLTTPLGQDVLVLERFDATEGLSELFEYHIDALSEQENVNFDDAIGKNCAINLVTHEKKERKFNGVLTEAWWVGKSEDELHRYRLILRPWLWLLGFRADCRIFLDKDVKEIIEEVFNKAGFNDYDFRLQESYEKIEYCVQYRETDLTFVSRLMEQYGIYYFFESSDDKHMLVLTDSRSKHKPIPELSKASYYNTDVKSRHKEQHIYDWMSERRFRTGKIQFNDYDYLKPTKKLLAPQEASEKYAHSKLEVYDYPGKYKEEDKGKKFAQIRLDAEQSLDHRRLANGDAPCLYPGGLVTIENHSASSENGQYLIVRASHSFVSKQQYFSGTGEGEEYHGRYEFLPRDMQFRALPVTKPPRIYGIQTAKVVAKKGEDSEEISTDEHGRIWVQFHWDREPQKSCPVRIAQVWASKQWGGIFIPRIGMEVVVEFLEGDPDRPLVTGCVYNGDNKVPWDLPKNKTQSGWKSDSSKGHRGYNQIQFEDMKNCEWINVHAQKDLNVTVLNNETRSVGNDMSTTIANSETREVGKKFKQPTGATSHKTTIKNGDYELHVENGKISTDAKVSIELKVGPSKLTIDPTGITLDAPTITIKAQTTCIIQGLPVKIN